MSPSRTTRRPRSARVRNAAIGDNPVRVAHAILGSTSRATLPRAEGIELAALYRPGADSDSVLVDAISLDESHIALFLFRFAGEGVVAALRALAARMHATRHLIAGAEPQTALLCACDDLRAACPTREPSAGCVAVLDLASNVISFATVGAGEPIIRRHGQREPLPRTVLDQARVRSVGARIDETRLLLGRGDWFILGSPGLRDLVRARATRSGPGQPLAAMLANASVAGLVARVRARCARPPAVAGDVALIALRISPRARRFRVIEKLGFTAAEPVQLTTVRYFEEMDRAAAGVLRAMDRQGYHDVSIRRMKIVLAELLVNALEHGNRRDPSKSVTVGHVVDTDCARVAVMDEGAGFDPSAVPDPTLGGNLMRDRGRGLYLARHFADRLVYNDKGNRVVAVMRFSAERAEASERQSVKATT